MPRFSSSELRTRLAEALRSAEGGETVVITRHGKPAAALIAADRLPRRSPPPAGRPDARGRGLAGRRFAGRRRARQRVPELAGLLEAGGAG